MQLTAEYFEQIIASLRHDRGGSSRSSERRGMARVGLRAQVTIVPCSAAPEATLAWIRDLSANGIGFMSARMLALDSFALVSLPRRDGTRLNLVYTVVRCVPAGTGQFLVGAHLERVVGREAA